MTQIFVSYATQDAAFALRIAHDIELLGHSVWIDQWSIGIGDPMFERISVGIEQADYLIVVLSQNTWRSAWVAKEWQIKYQEEMQQGKEIVLPVLIENCVIPPFLRPKRFADFRDSYETGFAQIASTLHTSGTDHPVSPLLLEPDQDARQPLNCASRQGESIVCYTCGMFKTQPRLTEINVELSLPYVGKIGGLWKPDEEEQQAAWELYIELVTRITVAELQPNEGLLRESLSSLYSIFALTRDILRKHGPSIARAKPGSELSFGFLAIHMLNVVLRPILSHWHPLLLDYEHTRGPAVSAFEHEYRWDKADALRQALNEARVVLADYTRILAHVADIPPLSKRQNNPNA